MKSFPLVLIAFFVAAVCPMNNQKEIKTKEVPSLQAIISQKFKFDELKGIIKNNGTKEKSIPEELAIELGKRHIFANESLTIGQKKELIEILLKKESNNEKTLNESDKKAIMHYKWLIEPLKPELRVKHDYIYDKNDIWSEKELKSPFCNNLLNHTLVSNATSNGFEQLLDALMYYVGKSILSLRDDNGKQPLHYTQEYRHLFYLTKKFIEYGADVNAQDVEGKTPLHDACYYVVSNYDENGVKSNITQLLAAGALKDIKNIHDQTPLDVLKKWDNYPEIERFFEKYENN